jgi:magnesium transporter
MKREVISVPARADQEEVGRILSRYDLLALPVVDDTGRMIGIVTVDDILDVMEQEATEDVQRLGGVQPVAEPYMEASLGVLFRKRVGWLLALYLAEALTGTVMRHYESFISQVVALAFFVPLLIGTGGNAGSQASSLIIRALAVGEVTPAHVLRVIWRESRLGLALGLAMGSAGVIRALLLGTGGSIALTVGLAQVAIVIWASLAGALLPLLGKRIGVDPAVFSTPLISTATDALGLIIYFEIARLVLGL